MNRLPNLKEEKRLWRENLLVIGIDEVGRGAFAGPLVVAGVVLEPQSNHIKIATCGINDSKKLVPKKRRELAKIIKREALFYTYATISVKHINKVGIGKATSIGVRRIIKRFQREFPHRKHFLLMDAFYIKYVKGLGLKNQKAIVKGDEKVLSIAAASIIAKVRRDSLMRKLHRLYPNYGFYSNKGYGTIYHRKAIKKFGALVIHREVFIRSSL